MIAGEMLRVCAAVTTGGNEEQLDLLFHATQVENTEIRTKSHQVSELVDGDL